VFVDTLVEVLAPFPDGSFRWSTTLIDMDFLLLSYVHWQVVRDTHGAGQAIIVRVSSDDQTLLRHSSRSDDEMCRSMFESPFVSF